MVLLISIMASPAICPSPALPRADRMPVLPSPARLLSLLSAEAAEVTSL